VLSSHPCLGLPSGLFLTFPPPKPCMHLYSAPYVLHAPSVSFFSILSPEQYWVSSTDHEAPHYVSFAIPLLPFPLSPNIRPNTLFSDTLSLRSSLSASDQFSHPYKITGRIIVLYILIFKFWAHTMDVTAVHSAQLPRTSVRSSLNVSIFARED